MRSVDDRYRVTNSVYGWFVLAWGLAYLATIMPAATLAEDKVPPAVKPTPAVIPATPAAPAQKSTVSPDRKQQIQDRDKLWNQARQLFAQGKRDEAVATGEQLIAAQRKLVSTPNRALGTFLDWLGWRYFEADRMEDAGRCYAEALSVRGTVMGEEHFETADSRRAVAEVKLFSSLTAEQRRELAAIHLEAAHMPRMYAQGAYRETIALADRVAAVQRRILGEKHTAYLATIANKGSCYERLGMFAQAVAIDREVVEAKRLIFGELHPDYAQALNNLAFVYNSMGQYDKAEPLFRQSDEIKGKTLGKLHPERALTLNNLGMVYDHLGNFKRAEECYREAMDINRQTIGEKNQAYASNLQNLGALYRELGNYAEAEKLLQQALEIDRQTIGERHPHYATVLNNLASLYQDMGEFAKAETALKSALQTLQQALGDKHPYVAIALNNLAGLYSMLGDDARAEQYYRQAIEMIRQAVGERSPNYASCLGNLASHYERRDNHAAAEPLLRQALEIHKQALGEQHLDYARTLSTLGNLLRTTGDYAQAEIALRRAAEIIKQLLGDQHPMYAGALQDLAALLQKFGSLKMAEANFKQVLEIREKTLGRQHALYAGTQSELGIQYMLTKDYASAEPLLVESVETTRKMLGDQHPEYAARLNNLASLYQHMGQLDRAEPMLVRAMEIRLQVLGPESANYAAGLNNLGMLYLRKGDATQAEAMLRKALTITRRQADQAAAVQSERQQLHMVDSQRVALNNYLTTVISARPPAETVYQELLWQKGAVVARQMVLRQLRQATGDNRPEVRQRFDELTSATRALAALSHGTPTPAQAKAHRQRLQELTLQIERLQRELSQLSATFAAAQSAQETNAATIAASLPANAVLVDFIGYTHFEEDRKIDQPPDENMRLLAFVLRHDHATVWVELGPITPIMQAFNEWRDTAYSAPGDKLRELVWAKIDLLLGDAAVVLISPDGPLGMVPWQALPGKQPGSYLIEDRAIALVSVPRLLPELLANEVAAPPSLLLVGDVDFGAAPESAPQKSTPQASPPQLAATQRAVPRDGSPTGRLSFARLPATKAEVDSLGELFGRRFEQATQQSLSGALASEQAIRNLAPRCRYLHLATHGYFAPLQVRNALTDVSKDRTAPAENLFHRLDLAGYHPGLLTGLALAGANQPAAAAGDDDGILTALEVGELDLKGVELATLSACETGMGSSRGGEGILGLQRAFQVAGARATVASLWNVSDHATQLLMTRFYENLWQRKLGKLESLREAQLWMLREARRDEQFANSLTRGLSATAKKLPSGPKQAPAAPPSGAAPQFWAGFVLSGDWR